MSDMTSTLLMVAGGGFTLICFLSLVFFYQKATRRQRQALGLKLLASMRVLLTHIQQHRGLTNGYLNGSPDLLAAIENLQKKVSRNFADVSAIEPDFEHNDRWQGITQHWARLAGNFKKHEPEHNLAQHNQLIKNVLFLIDEMAQACDLLLLRNQNQQALHLYWRELLAAAEFIGQARAIGTGVAAAAYCDTVSRVRLGYLCGQIQENTARLWRDISPAAGARSDITQLIECINEQLLGESPSITAAAYFALATQAIDQLLNQFDQLLKDQTWH